MSHYWSLQMEYSFCEDILAIPSIRHSLLKKIRYSPSNLFPALIDAGSRSIPLTLAKGTKREAARIAFPAPHPRSQNSSPSQPNQQSCNALEPDK